MGRKTEDSRKDAPYPHNSCGKGDNGSHHMQGFSSRKLPQKAREQKNQKREANNHGEINHMTQAGAIKSTGKREENRRIMRTSTQRA
jgi:hypothetical protein